MKTQHQYKASVLKEASFNNKKVTQQLKNNSDATAFDEELGFDTHWSYSYIMDYILSHKTKKRKS